MKTIRLITCDDAMQAHIIQGALENEGIESVLHNENLSSLLKSCVNNLSGVDIFVCEDDYDRALQVLHDNQSLPEELKYCPVCGSADITFKLRKGKRVKAACAFVLASLAVAFPVGDYWTYVCNHCKVTFDKPVSEKNKREKESQL
ncbi:putative signal transducing protein [Bacteroides sp.]